MPDPTMAIGGSAVLGLLGNQGDDTVTTQQQLPSFLQPYAPLYAQMGFDLSQMPYNPYPYETVAGFSQDQQAAMDAVRQRAAAGSPVVNAAQQQALSTINGDYLNPQSNPYLQQTYDLAANRMTDAYSRGTAAQTDANFARAGAFGGSAWNERQQANEQSLGDSLAMLGNQIFGNNYQRERQNQLGMSQFAPNFGAQDYRDAEALLNIGGMQQGLGQQYLTDDYSRFQQAQQYPYQQFQTFGQMFNPALGSQSTQTSPGVSPINGLLGGALGGLGMYNMGTQGGLWGGSGSLGSATASTPYSVMTGGGSGTLGSGTYGLWG